MMLNLRAGRKHFFPFEAVFTAPQLLLMPYLEGGSPRWKTKLEGISLVLLKWLNRRRAERLPGGADICVCGAKSACKKFASAEWQCAASQLFNGAEGAGWTVALP